MIDKHFKIFDIKKNNFCRRIDLKNMNEEAFSLSSNAETLVKVEGDQLVFVNV